MTYDNEEAQSALEEEPKEEEKAKRRPRSARVRHVARGRLVITGPSGQVYRFQGHGATLKVKGEDVERLLAYERRQRSCCGPRQPTVLRPLIPA
jgi:photosystem II stability/assembly factor-like uncharacterized protein